MEYLGTNRKEEIKIDFKKSYGWIQWKGTDVCIDIHCKKCNELTHFDGDFMYFITCVKCGTIYEANGHIELIEREIKDFDIDNIDQIKVSQ